MAGDRSDSRSGRSGAWRPSTAAATLRGQHAGGLTRRRETDTTRVASWQLGAVHIWGWTGPTRPRRSGCTRPAASRVAWATDPGGIPLIARRADPDRATPAADVGARPLTGGEWLRRVTADNDSVLWFAAIAMLAERTVQAQLITPQLRVLRGDVDDGQQFSEHTAADGSLASVELLAEWCPVYDDAIGAALDELTMAMAPICVPLIDHDDDAARAAATTEILAAFIAARTPSPDRTAGGHRYVVVVVPSVAAPVRSAVASTVGCWWSPVRHSTPCSPWRRAEPRQPPTWAAVGHRTGPPARAGRPARPLTVGLELVDEADPALAAQPRLDETHCTRHGRGGAGLPTLRAERRLAQLVSHRHAVGPVRSGRFGSSLFRPPSNSASKMPSRSSSTPGVSNASA